MKSYEIPSIGVTKQWAIEWNNERYVFQLFEDKIEHTSDWSMFFWSKGSTIKDVEEWIKLREFRSRDKNRKQAEQQLTKQHEDELLYAEEKKRERAIMEREWGDKTNRDVN